MDLVLATGRAPSVILDAIRRGRLQAMKPGREYLFTPEQFAAAVEYYGKLAKRENSDAR